MSTDTKSAAWSPVEELKTFDFWECTASAHHSPEPDWEWEWRFDGPTVEDAAGDHIAAADIEDSGTPYLVTIWISSTVPYGSSRFDEVVAALASKIASFVRSTFLDLEACDDQIKDAVPHLDELMVAAIRAEFERGRAWEAAREDSKRAPKATLELPPAKPPAPAFQNAAGK